MTHEYTHRFFFLFLKLLSVSIKILYVNLEKKTGYFEMEMEGFSLLTLYIKIQRYAFTIK